MRTRTTKPAPTDAEQKADKPTLISATPPKTLILPSNTSDDARFVSLENPRTGIPTRYLFCPEIGIHEFTAISPSASAPRSMLCSAVSDTQGETGEREEPPETSDKTSETEGNSSNTETKDSPPANGSVVKMAQLLVATPIDVLFFILPILSPAGNHTKASKLFQPLDDMLDSQDNVSKSLRNVLLHKSFREKVEARMSSICDTVEAGERMFRISEEKLVKELIFKAERMASSGLPPSMEERFVKRALELPVLSVKREDVTTTVVSEEVTTEAGSSKNSQERSDSQSTTASTTTTSTTFSTPSDASTPATESPPTESNTLDGIPHLLRVRTALSFIQSSYLVPHLSAMIEEHLNSAKSPVDFKPLTEHLKYIAGLRAEAQASRSMSDFSRKRGLDEDDEAAEARAEKKRKKEEEEKKKKAGESRGVRELKKVDTSGMKKLSAFFGKKT